MLRRLSVFLLGLLSVGPALAADFTPMLLSAADVRYRYEGRVDRAKPEQAVMIWSGSRASIDFEGSHLALVFGAVTDQAVFNVTVDGVTEMADLRAAARARYDWPHALGAGRHHLEIFKRSEAAKGYAAFAGIELAAGAQAWAPPAPAYKLKLEFFGDSITAGACNEDGAEDQWTDFRTHNFAQSWAHMIALAFSADHRAMAYSGMGIATGWEPAKAGEIWDKVYARADSPRADLAAWQPDVVFINFGENDDSYAAAQNQPFPPGYAPGYVELVKKIRGVYPRAQIVLLRGGMHSGAKSEKLRAAWESVVHEVEAADPRIAHFVFKHWSQQHPRVADDRAMADELTAWLKQQPFMKNFL